MTAGLGALAAAAPVRSKAAPGPGPTPEALLRALDVTVGRHIHGLLPGEFRAHDRGGGTELAQVRPYEPGDDVRRIETSGVSAAYRVVRNSDGTRRLIGQYCDTGQRFVYVIKRSGLVKGHVGNQPVSFRARHAA